MNPNIKLWCDGLTIIAILVAVYSLLAQHFGEHANSSYAIDFGIFLLVLASNIRGK